jgi:signal transduction histidine kinase/FixJ family two-component response regulator/HAMP domain-containing protein
MRFLENLSLYKKLLLSFLIVISLSYVAIFLSINALNTFNNKINFIVDNDIQTLINNLKSRRSVVELQMFEKELFLSANETEKSKNLFNISTAQEDVAYRFDIISKLSLDTQTTKGMEQFTDKYRQYNITLNRVMGLMSDGKTKEAFELSRTTSSEEAEAALISAAYVTTVLEKKFKAANDETDLLYANQIKITIIFSLGVFLLSIILAWIMSRSIVGRIKQLINTTQIIANGDYSVKNLVQGADEVGRLAGAIGTMQDKLLISHQEMDSQTWLKAGIARINKVILGQDDLNGLGAKIITEVAEYIDAQVGALYLLKDEENDVVLSLFSSYAYTSQDNIPSDFKYGEGLVGQVAVSRKLVVVEDVPKDYIRVISGLGEAVPRNICVTPLLFEENLQGVMEIGKVKYLNKLELEYITQVSEVIATAFEIAMAQERMQIQQEKMRVQQIELEEANDKLRNLDEMKTNFLSTVSHELRTPLTSVIGFARIMQKKFESVLYPALADNPDKKVQKAMRQVMDNTSIIVEEGQRLTTLINDVLDLAKMEAGRVDWNISELQIEDIIDRGIASTSSLFADKPVKLHKNIAANLPLCEGDRDRLIQVVINLISNAIKFTDEGIVTLKAEVKLDEVVVSVIDSGSGIKPEDQPLVFEKFKQVGDTMTDKPQGTGLGLPICKEIVEHLGGRLWLESEIGVGSTFMFSLPLSDKQITQSTFMSKEGLINKNTLMSNDGEEVSYVWHSNSESLEKAIRLNIEKPVIPEGFKLSNILIIDDNMNIREFLHQELSAVDYEVREASSGAEGLAMIAEQQPDLIILDVKMPHLNGFEVAVRLHTNPATMHIPVILHTITEDQVLGEQLGIDCYLNKPVKDTDLLTAVSKLLKAPRLRKKILLFIADPEKRKAWVSMLDKCGCETVAADNVSQGIESAVAFSPQLVIAEVSLANKFKIIDQLRVDLGLNKVLFTLLDDTKSI